MHSTKNLPEKELARRAIKVYMISALVWDYTETVLDIAVSLRSPHTKKLCRLVRQIHLDYDRLRQGSLDNDHIKKEWALAEQFESLCAPSISALSCRLESEYADIERSDRLLVISVQMAMTMLDVLGRYTSDCDRWIASYGVIGHSIESDHFGKLRTLLPEFAGDCYTPNHEARIKAGRQIYNEIVALELYD